MENIDNKENTEYISFLSVIAGIAVVFLHVNEVFWEYSEDAYWFFANIIENIFYFAAPMFFMITGVTLLDYRKRYSTKEYFKKRFFKTVIPFIFWSILAILYGMFIRKSIMFENLSVKAVICGIFDTKYISYFWFFPALFSVYLCIPLFSAIKEELKIKILKYCLITGFVFNICIPFALKILEWEISNSINVLVSTQYMFYAILGYLLHNEKIDKKLTIFIYIIAIISLLTNMFGTYILTSKYRHIINSFRGYTNLPCTVYSAGVFLFVKNILQGKNQLFYKVIKKLKSYTYPICLIHGFVMDILKLIFKFNIYSLLYRLLIPLVIIPICIIITYIVKKIPILRRVLP